jgi:hypothetical protein
MSFFALDLDLDFVLVAHICMGVEVTETVLNIANFTYHHLLVPFFVHPTFYAIVLVLHLLYGQPNEASFV